jgi:hypothetical protein
MRAMPRTTLVLLACAFASLLPGCSTTSGSAATEPEAEVRFDYDAVHPETVRIQPGSAIVWTNIAPDTRAVIVFPATTPAAMFSCAGNVDFQKTRAGYSSRPIDPDRPNPVRLPCPLASGTYPYEVWITGTGLGATVDTAGRKLGGTILVE